MVSGPELARTVAEFEEQVLCHEDNNIKHREHTYAAQKTFFEQVISLVSTIEDMGNPFLEKSEDLLVLDTKDIVDQSVVETVKNIEQIGNEDYSKYVEQKLLNSTTPISECLTKHKLPLFCRPQPKPPTRVKLQASALQDDCELMSRLYVSCQARTINLDDFFMHENHPYPPSLSDHGKLHTSNKSDLVKCLENLGTSVSDSPSVDAVICDGAAVVHLLHPRTAQTFNEYASTIFLPYIEKQLQNTQRVDIVWDTYMPESLKTSTRIKRGQGIRRRVLGTSKIPSNWMKFLRVSANKEELFSFLTHFIMDYPHEEKVIYATDKEKVLCSQRHFDCEFISPCNHEEADTRVIIHACDAARKGNKNILIRTVDTDILVLAIANVERIGAHELWLAFGTGKDFRYLPAHEIANALGVPKASSLPAFHAFTGCDTVSGFSGKGKKSAWEVWRVFPEVTEAFIELSSSGITTIRDELFELLERFVIVLYDRTSQLTDINNARKDLFTRKGRFKHASLPPTNAALTEHAKRAAYQSAHVWGQCMKPQMMLPSPKDWGWSKLDDMWVPHWTELPEASKGCRELIKCGCKKGCTATGRCGCSRVRMPCTPLCSCICMDTN